MEQNTKFHINHNFILDPLSFNDFKLIQIGRRYCKSRGLVPLHPHSQWFELTIVTGGQGIITSNGIREAVKSGDIYLSVPHDIHEILSVEDLEYDFLSFYYEDGKYAQELNALISIVKLSNSRIFKDERISFLVNNAILEFMKSNSIMQNELLYGIFTQISVYLLRNIKKIKRNTTDFSDNNALCYQLMNYIDTHIYSIKNLDDITKEFNYNYSYLSTLFKRTTGKTLFRYFQDRRLDTALMLLLENKKIGEVANLLGYQDQFAFSKAFKTKYGLPPSKYIKTIPHD